MSTGLSRRTLLGASLLLPGLRRPVIARAGLSPTGLPRTGLPRNATTSGAFRPAKYGLTVHPRDSWGANLAAKGPLPVEEDVRFLLAHHSASSNSYTEAGVPGLIRGFYGFHTGPDKRWPDVAYSFFVDKFGGVWEGRTGSTAKPVAGSATGGNQGYTRLCCLIGDYSATTPTESQQASLVKLLATLADWHGIDTAPGAQTTFVSKGSNKHPRGTQVTTRTIEGHRSMSTTSCPGDSAYALVPGLQARVTKLRAG